MSFYAAVVCQYWKTNWLCTRKWCCWLFHEELPDSVTAAPFLFSFE